MNVKNLMPAHFTRQGRLRHEHGRLRLASGQTEIARESSQSSICNPGTRANSFVLLVTKVAPKLSAWAAMKVSKAPIAVPEFSRTVRPSRRSRPPRGLLKTRQRVRGWQKENVVPCGCLAGRRSRPYCSSHAVMIERPMTQLLCAESFRRIDGELVCSRSIHTVVSSRYKGLSLWSYRRVCRGRHAAAGARGAQAQNREGIRRGPANSPAHRSAVLGMSTIELQRRFT
jgi:hypothetical protein